MPNDQPRPIPAEQLTAVGPGALSLDEKATLVGRLRRGSPATSRTLDRLLLEQVALLRTSHLEAREQLGMLEAALEQLTSPPLVPALYLGTSELGAGPAVEVAHANARRIVPVAEDVDVDRLRRGDEVLLNGDLSVMVARSPTAAPGWGDTAVLDRFLPDGTMLVRCRDELLVLGVAAAATSEPWAPGDLVRWERGARLALSRIEPAESNEFLLQTVPDVGPEAVGGQDANLRRLINGLMVAALDRERQAPYGLDGQMGVLLVGPPGVGKTLLAKVALAQVQRRQGRQCRLCVVKPGEWEDMYVGQTQRRIRDSFACLRRAGGLGVIFIDEIESIGRHRGGMVSHHADKALAALLAELQGFDADPETRIVVIAATNRLDLLDSALVDRLPIQLAVDRPDRRAARAIFEIHMPEHLPCSRESESGPCTRTALIERAVSRFYSPNADNGICTIRFRDNTQRTVTARELASGRGFRNISAAAAQAAAFRACDDGDPGVRFEDVDEAVADAFDRMSSALSRQNAHHYLPDLPQDMDVVAVEPVRRRVARPHHYLSVA